MSILAVFINLSRKISLYIKKASVTGFTGHTLPLV